MSNVRQVVAAIALAFGSTAIHAQAVKGNEAVTTGPDGRKQVQTPPLPAATLPAVCPAARAGCSGGGWLMVETADGLRECTEIYARQGSCRVSTYGSEKLLRLWIVKSKGQWLQCQYPDLGSKCVSTKSLPYAAAQ